MKEYKINTAFSLSPSVYKNLAILKAKLRQKNRFIKFTMSDIAQVLFDFLLHNDELRNKVLTEVERLQNIELEARLRKYGTNVLKERKRKRGKKLMKK